MVLGTFFLFIVFLSGFVVYLIKLPPQTMAYGVSIGPFNVGGMSYDEARQLVSSQTNAVENRGIDIVYKNISVNISSVYNSLTNPDLSLTIFDYDTDGSLENAFALGHEGSLRQQYLERLRLRFYGQKVPLALLLKEEALLNILQENFSQWEKPFRNAGFRVAFDSPPEITIIAESSGQVFNYNLATAEFKQRLNKLDPTDIKIKLSLKEPTIEEIEVKKLKPVFEEVLTKGDLIFVYQDKKFKVIPEKWSGWVRVDKKRGEAELALNKAAVEEYFKQKISPEVEIPVKEARFVTQENKVAEFQPSQPGQVIDWTKMWPAIDEMLFWGGERGEITIVVDTVQPQVTTESVNDLGIKEVIGVGTSNFSGSPNNRRHNIRVGADTLNGVLIAPQETFSLLTALGPVDGAHGYLPELVIKKDKTIPEFGGGLCQIGTTVFRAALGSGLPIVERQSHSYRVSYYEPAGIDATIYSPRPDMRFLNDTGHYILVRTRIEKNNLFFEFWGAKDERTIEQTKPKIYNFKPPPPSQLLETLDLPVGKKKCTEKPHTGADAVFTYTVTYPDGAVKKQDFRSHYKPWGEVCLIGVEKLSTPPTPEGGDISASSTVQKNP